jgi:hypothetical protein
MPRLTDSELVILSAAARRDGGTILPTPKSLKVKGRALNSIFQGLLKKGLVAEQHAPRGSAAWREAEDGQRMMLVITDAGLNAINVDADERSEGQVADGKGAPKKQKQQKSRTTPSRKTKAVAGKNNIRPGTKLAMVVALLSRGDGATIDEIVKATGWQAHSVRGAISGALKKKLGLTVTSEKIDGRGRVYRIASGR